MKKTMKMNRLVVAVGLVGSVGMAANSASAADFDVTTEVLNTLAITVDQPMNLGTIFAVESSSGDVNSLRLSPAGVVGDGAITDSTLVLIGLGGEAAARGSVDPSDNNFSVVPPSVTVPETDAATAHGTLDSAVTAGTAVEVSINTGNTGVARFYLANFQIGSLTGGTFVGGTQSAAGAAQDIVPDFGVTSVSFGIGADIFTDPVARTYQNGTYEGTFEVTAEFL